MVGILLLGILSGLAASLLALFSGGGILLALASYPLGGAFGALLAAAAVAQRPAARPTAVPAPAIAPAAAEDAPAPRPAAA